MYDGEINMDMLEESLADFASSLPKKVSRWTPELDALLVKVREEHGLTWEAAARWWKKEVGWGGEKALMSRYKEIRRDA